MENNLELRMYSIVMYNLSPIQKGIQSMHSIVEAVNHFQHNTYMDETLFKEWALDWKTVIILDGGTSNDIQNHFDLLLENHVRINQFREPDLNNSMSAISFILDERVFNYEKYPTLETSNRLIIEANPNAYLLSNEDQYYDNLFGTSKEGILFLRKFISQFNLAR